LEAVLNEKELGQEVGGKIRLVVAAIWIMDV